MVMELKHKDERIKRRTQKQRRSDWPSRGSQHSRQSSNDLENELIY